MQILLYILMLFLIFRLFAQRRQNVNMSKFIELVKLVNNEEEFLRKSQEEIDASETDEERTKFQVLRLWGIAQHARYDEFDFDGLLQDIELKYLFENSKMNNDDTLFYFFLAIPNILYRDQETEKMAAMFDKMEDYLPQFENRLDYEIGKANREFYEGDQEKAVVFYEKVMEGDYGEYTYSKQLIGLYKETVAIMLLKYYQDNGNDEKFKEYESLGAEYYTTRIGGNMIKNINLVIPGVTNVSVTDVSADENEDTDENVIDAEIVEHSEDESETELNEEPKEISVEEESDTGTTFGGEE